MSRWDDSITADPLEDYIRSAEAEPVSRLPATCPICKYDRVHIYFRRHTNDGFGGGWVWCSHCRRFFHGRVKVPTWWVDATFLSDEALTAVPDDLDSAAAAIDRHWNAIVPVGGATRSDP
jgi:hypothetical protein